MRFCSRCGLALSGLAEWITGSALPAKGADEIQNVGLSRRRKGIRRAAKLMFFSGVLVPVFLVISLIFDEGGPMIIPFVVFFVSLVMMLYARLFSDNTAAFIHDLPEEAISNVSGDGNYVRVQVLTPVGVLDREKQPASSRSSPRSSWLPQGTRR